MRFNFGYLALLVFMGCGQSRDFGSGGFKGIPPKKVGEVRGFSSLGPTVLSLYRGEVDPGKVLGWVGDLAEIIENTEVRTGEGGTPFEQKTEELAIRNNPVYLLSSGPEKTELAAFLDDAFSSHIKQPVFFSRKILISPVIRYCGQYEFKGNSYLRKPLVCNGTSICFLPQPGTVECGLDTEARKVCASWQKIPGFDPPKPTAYSRASYEFIAQEPNAFVCNQWRNDTAYSYHLQERKKLVGLKILLDRNIKIKVELPGNSLDSGASETKWVQFQEETLDFSWDK